MKKVGLLTFHAAYNYGSVLQAYATQFIVEKLGYRCEVINFRMKSQKQEYALYKVHSGLRFLVRNILLIPFHFVRIRKNQSFENFINSFLHLSMEYETREDLQKKLPQYDIYLSGSDQIWNENVAEISRSKPDYSGVYYFDFISSKKKISYGSSIGNMKVSQLEEKKNLLRSYQHLSTREKSVADLLEKLLGKKVEAVLDPTMLLSEEEWCRLCEPEPIITEPYVLLYSLGGRRRLNTWYDSIRIFSRRHDLKIVFLCPEYPFRKKDVISMLCAGPKEFLNLYRNASVVLADSFHGIVFSLIFKKPFYTLGNKYYKDDIRKLALLSEFGFPERSIDDESDIETIADYNLDYTKAEVIFDREIGRSVRYLQSALDD